MGVNDILVLFRHVVYLSSLSVMLIPFVSSSNEKKSRGMLRKCASLVTKYGFSLLGFVLASYSVF